MDHPAVGKMSKAEQKTKRDVAIVTGPAGAGRSTAIHALEDFGFEAIDNLPISFLDRLFASDESRRPIAIGIDARTRDFSAAALWEALAQLSANPDLGGSLVFLDCSTDGLLRRFSETRRRHPLAPDGTARQGSERERELLAPLRETADILVDTSEMAPHDLRAELGRWFATPAADGLSISVQSFSYKRGAPRAADIVLDCRFLQNPHWERALRPLTGQDPAVAAHVAADPLYAPFHDRVLDLIQVLLPAFVAEGKSYLTLAFGCTGGRHRSVAVSQSVAKSLAADGWRVSTRHRELERAPVSDGPRRVVNA